MIAQYDTFNNEGCPNELIFGDFIEQPIPSDYYNFLKDYDDGGNNVTENPVYNSLPDNKGVKDSVMPSNEDINHEIIIIDDKDRLVSNINHLQKEMTEIQGVDNKTELR